MQESCWSFSHCPLSAWIKFNRILFAAFHMYFLYHLLPCIVSCMDKFELFLQISDLGLGQTYFSGLCCVITSVYYILLAHGFCNYWYYSLYNVESCGVFGAHASCQIYFCCLDSMWQVNPHEIILILASSSQCQQYVIDTEYVFIFSSPFRYSLTICMHANSCVRMHCFHILMAPTCVNPNHDISSFEYFPYFLYGNNCELSIKDSHLLKKWHYAL